VSGLANLPALNDEELDELRIAIALRMNGLAEARALAASAEIVAECDRRGLICQSLSTAVAEARLNLR